jgi:hypothetical protein
MNNIIIQKSLDFWSSGHLSAASLLLERNSDEYLVKNNLLLARYFYNSGHNEIAYKLIKNLPRTKHNFEENAYINYTFGFIEYEINQNFSKAKYFFTRSDFYCRNSKIDDDILILRFANNWRLGMILCSEKNLSGAKKHFDISKDIADNLYNNHLKNIYLLSQVWVNYYSGNYSKAYDNVFTALYKQPPNINAVYLNSEFLYSLGCIEQKTDTGLIHLFTTFQKSGEIINGIGHGFISNPFEGSKKIYPFDNMNQIFSDYNQLFRKKYIFTHSLTDFGITPSCVICGSTEDLTIDHIIPQKWGGSNIKNNKRVLCRSCNSKKGGLFTKSDFNAYEILIKNIV